ncbi:hypothetical protein V8D89_009458 [Ganoderma adspersum]
MCVCSTHSLITPFHADDACRLLPSHKIFTPDRTLTDKVITCLSTRFSALPAAVREALPATFGQWAKFCILLAGDTIHAAEMVAHAEDGRDVSYVRVRSHFTSLLPCFSPLDLTLGYLTHLFLLVRALRRSKCTLLQLSNRLCVEDLLGPTPPNPCHRHQADPLCHPS